MSRATSRAVRTLFAALLLSTAVALLAACGGGDPEPEKQIGPPDCQHHPEQCA